MALTDFEVYDQYRYNTAIEMLRENLNVFNASTRGAIVLSAGSHRGDFDETSMYEFLQLVRRRNAYGTGTVTPVALQMIQDRSVKVASGTAPLRYTRAQFSWILKNPREAGVKHGEVMAQQMLKDYLDTAILAAVAALSGEAEVVNNAGINANQSLNNLQATARLFGDQASNIAVWLMHSKSLHDVYAQTLTNANTLFQFGSIFIREDGFGRILVMTDSDNLVVPAPSPQTSPETPVRYRTLGLVPGAVEVQQNDDFTSAQTTITGQENIMEEIQSEWTFQLAVRGFAFATGANSANRSPNDATLGNSANWDRYVTSHKDLAGVLATTL